jgi:hypothetical protein
MGPDVGTIDVLPINLGTIVADLLLLAYFGAALFFLVQLVIGGFSWMSAGGDPKALESARSRITNAVIGIVIVAAAFGITIIITTALGINIFSGTIITIP